MNNQMKRTSNEEPALAARGVIIDIEWVWEKIKGKR
jgi:hypothetical protein